MSSSARSSVRRLALARLISITGGAAALVMLPVLPALGPRAADGLIAAEPEAG